MAIFVSNLQEKTKIDDSLEDRVIELAEKIMEREGVGGAELSIAFVDDPYIHKLNSQYRNIDAPTDVLSFYFDGEDEEDGDIPAEGMEHLLGDVVISLETATRQAADFGHGFEREVLYLTAHGILHLCGYDHDTEENRRTMRDIEEEVLKNI